MKKLIFCFIFFSCNFLWSQENVATKIIFTHENDLLGFINNDDDNYTGGFSFELQRAELNFIQPFFKLANAKNIQRITLAGAGYTPQNLAASAPIIGDRPYASFVYLGYGLISIHKNGAVLTSELNIGLMGLSAPGKLQSWIHSSKLFKAITDRPVPEGWHNQIANGGALMVNYNVKYSFNLIKNKEKEAERNISYFDPSFTVSADLGNYMTNINLGLYLDLFNLNNNPSLEYDNRAIQKQLNLENIDLKKSENNVPLKKFSMNLFFKPNLRFNIYNATLQGLLFNDSSIYKIPASEVKTFLFEFNTGLNFNFNNKWLVRYTLSARSREFKGGKSMHYWGGLTIGYTR
ncbi:lipid A-modifier LpxR family protein [Polaribacter sp.]|uniref:lipid A-modifier LpxR family protein n=1 Tax=Polaribacter sp. TaxID=1920175 RepID=UPI003EF48525